MKIRALAEYNIITKNIDLEVERGTTSPNSATT